MFRKVWGYILGMVVHPRATLEELAQQPLIHPAVELVMLELLLAWLNLLLFAVFGYDWLGTRRELLDPTYIGFFGQLRVGTTHYIPIFNGMIAPLLALLGLAVMPGLAQVLSKLWHGRGTYESMVNTLTYAQVPSVLIRSVLNDMLLGGVLTNAITGHPYAFTAAMNGEFGPTVATLWWVYMIGAYIVGVDLWIIALGTMAIRRVQRIPWWAAALVMTFVYVLWFYGVAGSVVR